MTNFARYARSARSTSEHLREKRRRCCQPEQYFRHQAYRVGHHFHKRRTDDWEDHEKVDRPHSNQRCKHEAEWINGFRVPRGQRPPDERKRRFPSITASTIWTVTPNIAGAAGAMRLPRSRRHPAGQHRRASACGGTVQENPRHLGEAAGCAGDNPIPERFKRGLTWSSDAFRECLTEPQEPASSF